jgi:hypothetical protein
MNTATFTYKFPGTDRAVIVNARTGVAFGNYTTVFFDFDVKEGDRPSYAIARNESVARIDDVMLSISGLNARRAKAFRKGLDAAVAPLWRL